MGRPVFDVFVCQGRLCTAHGSDALVERAEDVDPRSRVLRGGCYGLCEIGPNVVVRRFAAASERADDDADRLTLTDAENETVYSRVGRTEMDTILRAHLTDDRAVESLTRRAREALEPPKSDVAARIRALREKRKADEG